MQPTIVSFSGHRNKAEVTCLSSFSPFAGDNGGFSFSSADARGFVFAWDERAPGKPAAAAMPFVTHGGDAGIVHTCNGQHGANHYAVALSESRAALIDWRSSTKAPVWALELDVMACAVAGGTAEERGGDGDAFARAMWRPGRSATAATAAAASSEVSLFTDDGKVFVVDGMTGQLARWSPSEVAELSSMQVPCGVSPASFGGGGGRALASSRCALVASTLGELSLVDTRAWRVAGSVKLGGLQDEAADVIDSAAAEQQQKGFAANPPLLASLDVTASPFICRTVAPADEKKKQDDEDGDEEDDDEDVDDALPTSLCALVARADGAIAFAHVEPPTTYPCVVRLFDMQAFQRGTHQLCSAHWMTPTAGGSNAKFHVVTVGRGGATSLWTVPKSLLDPREKDEEDEENDAEESDEANVDIVASVSLFASRNRGVSAAAASSVDVTCTTVVADRGAAGSLPHLVAGDATGSIQMIKFA